MWSRTRGSSFLNGSSRNCGGASHGNVFTRRNMRGETLPPLEAADVRRLSGPFVRCRDVTRRTMMTDRPTHSWEVTTAEARAIQESLRGEVIAHDELPPVRLVAGVDVGFEQANTITRAAVAVLSFPELALQDYAIARRLTRFPYVPGLLSFREIPAVLDALERLCTVPHLLLCDGQGIAHPRRFGIACHLGVLTGLPSVGVAKSRLIGTHRQVPEKKGAWVALEDGDEVIGAVLRTRTRVKPLYVSVGHKVSLPTAVDYVMRCVTRYRLPETTRWADRLASSRRADSLLPANDRHPWQDQFSLPYPTPIRGTEPARESPLGVVKPSL
jgi:deoxyribonuclease V